MPTDASQLIAKCQLDSQLVHGMLRIYASLTLSGVTLNWNSFSSVSAVRSVCFIMTGARLTAT